MFFGLEIEHDIGKVCVFVRVGVGVGVHVGVRVRERLLLISELLSLQIVWLKDCETDRQTVKETANFRAKKIMSSYDREKAGTGSQFCRTRGKRNGTLN